MPRRRQSVAPLTDTQYYLSEIDKLEKRIARLESPRMSAAQTLSDTQNLNDPAQGMTAINATTGKFQYYHDNAWRDAGAAAAEWAALYNEGDYQTFANGNQQNLKFALKDQSVGSASTFSFGTTFDATWGKNVYTLRLAKSGIYGITLNTHWVYNGSTPGNDIVGKSVIYANDPGDQFPGELDPPFNGLESYFYWNDGANISGEFWIHVESHVIPIRVPSATISTPEDLIIAYWYEDTASPDSSYDLYNRAWITYLGNLNHDNPFA